MVRVKIFAGELDNGIGAFEIEQLPRTGEAFTIPWPDADFGARIFVVGEVIHLAVGAPNAVWGPGPQTILRLCDEIA